MKVSDLTGTQLDFWVAKIEGLDPQAMPKLVGGGFIWKGTSMHGEVSGSEYQYSADWSRGGPIIEQKKIMISWNVDHWISGANDAFDNPNSRIWSGRTALIAAMRAHVASRFGDEVPD